MAGYIVVGPVAVLPTVDGTERYMYRGALVSDEFTEVGIERALGLGLLAEVPDAEELLLQAEIEREAAEAADRAKFDDAVNAAAVKLVAERDAQQGGNKSPQPKQPSK